MNTHNPDFVIHDDSYAEEVTDSFKQNRAARRRAISIRATKISKKQPFGRILGAYFDEKNNRMVLRHTTRGVVGKRHGKAGRQMTDHLMNELLAG